MGEKLQLLSPWHKRTWGEFQGEALPLGPVGNMKGRWAKEEPAVPEMTAVWMSIFCLWHWIFPCFMRKNSTFCLTLYNIPILYLPTAPEKLKHVGKDCYELGHEQVVVLHSPLVLHKLSLSWGHFTVDAFYTTQVCLLSNLRGHTFWCTCPSTCYDLKDNILLVSGIITTEALASPHTEKKSIFLFFQNHCRVLRVGKELR